ncbi:type 4a pilus biogenesis protein PilO [Bacillus sp. FJAT-50079]|uniref:type 4a pilus biogenesis protein PilO n=1 Tax=Bacillus sp. FJAT-50079 TaxID=2833577 RepID=UPI001BCA308C|nr:type 4a pilus biogenesis protein PilO [Bacillus sp. FJAT-50079]MBS4208949.1 type 4a pilus biogenesis protein PilO [Bacillus sp. FJAT-50079]
MNNLFEEKRTLFLLLLSLFFLLLLSIYLAFLQPLSSELQSKKNMKVTLEGDIAILEAKSKSEAENSVEDSPLLSKIPLHPELEKLVLSFQKVETASDSLINNIEFHYDSNENEVDEEGENAASTGVSKPDGLHSITAELTVLSPDYDHFMKFMNEIEMLDRITSVDQLKFFQPDQESSTSIMNFTIVITTYYFDQ